MAVVAGGVTGIMAAALAMPDAIAVDGAKGSSGASAGSELVSMTFADCCETFVGWNVDRPPRIEPHANIPKTQAPAKTATAKRARRAGQEARIVVANAALVSGFNGASGGRTPSGSRIIGDFW